ncbi:MAG: hypothetical protein NUV77_23245 [Thermoguttaceae bacterium]|nr:hypothetical protein [Thermoguttaceae bacterium]
MAWLDPPECVAARDALAAGNPTQAAQRLLASKYPQHREVRRLLAEAGNRLVETARRQYESGHVEAAFEAIQWAGRCMPLEGDALALSHSIAAAHEARRDEQAWVAGQVAKAKHLAQEGHLLSALDVLRACGSHAGAERAQAEVNEQLSRFQRALEACRQCVESNRAEAAYRHWQIARGLMPHSPELAELAGRIARVLARNADAQREHVPVSDRAWRFLLGPWALAVSSAEVCLGTARAEGVHVPLQAPLHGRHAVLLRDRQGWQLAPCRDGHDRPCRVNVAGHLVETLYRLADGDVLELGGPHCQWRFRLPLPGSTTAVLEATFGSQGLAWTPGGRLVSRVVLLDRDLVVRPYGEAHLVVPDLACKELRFRWEAGQLQWLVEGGSVRVEVPGRSLEASDQRVYLPSRLVICPELDEPELLGRTAAGCPPADEMQVDLTDPFLPSKPAQ